MERPDLNMVVSAELALILINGKWNMPVSLEVFDAKAFISVTFYFNMQFNIENVMWAGLFMSLWFYFGFVFIIPNLFDCNDLWLLINSDKFVHISLSGRC